MRESKILKKSVNKIFSGRTCYTFFVLPIEETNTSFTDCGSTGLLLVIGGWGSSGLVVVTISTLLESCVGVTGIALLTDTVCNLSLL